ncbi:MAG TPA: dTMP kinase [Syntrophales bacterium]|nr:dTMP kinase [Syntrophales bacterium]
MQRFVTFEGIEGCGKSTQVRLTGDYLKKRGVPFITTEEPGGTSLGRRIRALLLRKPAKESAVMSSEAELLLFCAARAQHVRELILPSLKEGKVVLCDRFSDATIAYQGFGRGLDIDAIKRLDVFSTGGLMPDLTLLFDLPVETGLKRAMARIAGNRGVPAEDRFEREALEFHRNVREGYLSLAGNEPERFRIIDASKDIDSVHRDVSRHLAKFLDA